jgi:hypothetical protein
MQRKWQSILLLPRQQKSRDLPQKGIALMFLVGVHPAAEQTDEA